MQHDTKVRLTYECERELLRKAQAGDNMAVETLVLAFRPLVQIVVRRQYKCSYSDQRYDDMCQDGIVGLYSAIQKYNLEYSVRFSTYAVHWIRRHISDSLQSATVLAEPYGTAARRRLVRKVQEELQKSTPSPSPEAIAERSGLSLAAVKHHVFGIGTQSYSLDAHFETDDGAGSARGYMLRDTSRLLPEEHLLAKEELQHTCVCSWKN